MPPLRELQAAFGRALLGEDDAMGAGVLGDGLLPAARVRIYRHHVFSSLTAALEATYPVVCRLVDRRFFAYAADRYIRANPPEGPCLFEYGEAFAAFLAAFPPCQDLGYLPDVARLEWAMNVALHAPEAEPIDPARLGRVAPDELARLVVRLHPSVSLVQSPWPIDRIWRANQGDADPDASIDASAGGVRLEVSRQGDDVVFRALEPAMYALRSALAAGADLGAAAEAALGLAPRFDLAPALRALLDEALIVDLMVPSGNKETH